MQAQWSADSLWTSLRAAVEQLPSLADAAGVAGSFANKANNLRLIDSNLNYVFALQSLRESEFPEAARATQRAIRLLQDGRDDLALRELHDAKQINPSSCETFCNLGGAYHTSGDDNAALFWYREALRLCPRNDVAVLALSLLEHSRGQSEEAQQLLISFLQDVDPSHVGALKQLGKIHLCDERFSKAAGCYHRLIAIDSTNPEWPAMLQASLDKLPCKDDSGRAVQNPYAPLGIFARAFSFPEPVVKSAMPVNRKQGLETTDRLVDRNDEPPPPPPIRPKPSGAASGGIFDLWNGGISIGFGSTSGTSSRASALEEARHLREVGQPDRSIQMLHLLLRQDCHFKAAQILLASCHQDREDFRAALEVAKEMLAQNPDDPEANLLVAELILASSQDASMADPYLNSTTLNKAGSNVPQYRILCAYCEASLAREDYVKALASAAEAVRIDASIAQALLLLGTCRLRVAEYPAALRAFRAALAACAGGVPAAAGSPAELQRLRLGAHVQAAQAHERLRQYPAAEEEARKALEVNPNFSAARNVLAMVQQQSGRGREAERDLEQALQRDPRNASARLLLGYFRLCSGDFASAVSLLDDLVAGGCHSVGESPRANVLSRSSLGAAKVYLALALDAQSDRSGQQRAEALTKEALALHKNFRHVWSEIDSGLAGQPLAAVQRLRGICDLDLSSQQARQVLWLLGRGLGRAELTRCFQEQQQSPQQQHTMSSNSTSCSSSSRVPSVPPYRWAPSGPSYDTSANASAAAAATNLASGGVPRLRSASPAPWVSTHMGNPALPSPTAGRGRSASPGPLHPRCSVGSLGYSNGPSGLGPGGYRNLGTPTAGRRGSRPGSREASPVANRTSVELNWSEVIRPDQLVFGPILGSGGSAQVYRGSYNGREVAIKKISGVAHLDEMMKEINALRRLKHPRLVCFLGACIQPPLLLVVTEYMAGGSLHERLFGSRMEPPLPSAQVWNIALQMLDGLNFLHSQRVVHRDLKTMNILLDSLQNAKICDFGLAQQMQLEATHIVRNAGGEGGSPRYMAPECYDAAHGKLTDRVDIWAMGCILIELFSRVLAYADCQTIAQLSTRIVVERRPPAIPAVIPEPVAARIQRCVAFEPSQRPSAQEVHGELTRLRGSCR